MSAAGLDDAIAILSAAPGPAPWYATQAPQRNNEFLPWCTSIEGGSLANFLVDTAGAVLLALPRYSCAQLLTPSRLLCWQSSQDAIVLRLFNTDAFHTPLAKSISAAREKITRADMAWASGLVWEGKLSRTTGGRRYVHEFPSELEKVDEVLILASGETQLYQLLPMKHEVAVYPQDWFNKGDYDLGYQWPMSVAREARSREVVGYGMRLGIFILDSTLRNVSTWLRKDDLS